MKKIGFIGTGNMGGAIATAVAGADVSCALYLSDYNAKKVSDLASEIGAKVSDNATIAAECDCIFLGVKPQMMADLLGSVAPVLQERKDSFYLVSMAAGVKIADIQRMAGGNYPVIRIMPNTPVSVGAGMILYAPSEAVDPQMLDLFLKAMGNAGVLDALPEASIDAACALSGCGPAFVCLFIEAMADAAVACGLPRDKATLYAEQTLFGTAKLSIESGSHPAVLKDAVCSPGGSTIAGVHALENGAFRGAVMDAVVAAYKRTLQLGEK